MLGRRVATLLLPLLVATAACPKPAERAASSADAAPASAPAGPAGRVTLSIVGTSDQHGRVRADGDKGGVDRFAGYLANLRAARAADGGGVVLVDAGDIFQGTLESNGVEGAVMIDVMNTLGYQGAAVGNHEFDFGPEGPEASAGPGQDPRGALRARARQARFPLLMANVVESATGRAPAWDNIVPATLVEVAGVKIGLVGVTTVATPTTTLPANFVGLAVTPPGAAILREATALRRRGAQVVVVVAHVGGRCAKLDDPKDLSSCDPDEEIMEVVQGLPAGAVDVVVAGHSHQGMAHEIGGVAVVQSFANGKAFGRVDLVVAGGKVVEKEIHRPQDIVAGSYEGKPVVADAALAASLADDIARADALRGRALGVTLADEIERAYDQESELGNLFADAMLAWAERTRPRGKARYVAMTNGGGLRADMDAGPLTYGTLYEAYPFDNRFGVLAVSGAELREVVRNNLGRTGGILSVAGVRVEARCRGARLEVVLIAGKRVLTDADPVVLVVSDFLATGGDGTLGKLSARPIDYPAEPLIRDGIAAELEAGSLGKTVAGPRLLDARAPRLRLPGARPIRCH